VRCNHIKLEACGCEKEFLAKMVVDAVMALGEASHLDMIGIKKVKILLVTPQFSKSLLRFSSDL
jgi:hypothetical protein